MKLQTTKWIIEAQLGTLAAVAAVAAVVGWASIIHFFSVGKMILQGKVDFEFY